MYTAWTDGSVRSGNPGIAGIAVYVEHDGVCVHKNAELLPQDSTSNEAEYKAVIAAITYLKSVNISNDSCIIVTDSQLVYGHVIKNWKCNFAHLRVLRDEIRGLLREIPFKLELRAVSRTHTEKANTLAQAITDKEKKDRGRNYGV